MRKALALLLALVMVLGLFAGCGATTESAASVQSAASAPAEEAPVEADVPEEEASMAEEVSVVEAEPVAEEEKGPFVAESATNLPLADGEVLTYFVELPGYMSMFNVNTYDDLDVHKKAEEMTGVDIEFTIVNNESLQTNFSLMVAGGDITDLVSGGSQQYSSSEAMIEDGVAIDLSAYEDLLPNFMNALDYYSDFKKVAYNQSGQLPEVICISDEYYVQGGLQIRKDWLDEQGMEVPTTYDELHDALAMFVSEYGADHALLMQGSCQLTGLSLIGGMGTTGYATDDASNMYVKDGVIQNGFLDEAYKEYMMMMAQWYEEGIVNPGFASESSDPFTSNADAYISGGNAGVWVAQVDNIDKNTATGIEFDDNYEIAGMAEPTIDGENFHFGSDSTGANAMGKNISISDCCENVELACAYLDFYFTREGIELANYGIEGVSMSRDENGNGYLNDTVLNNPDFPMVSFATTYYTLACAATLTDFDRMFRTYSEANLAAMDLWTSTQDNLYSMPAQVELDYDQSTRYSELWSDINTLASTEVFKFVMGEYNFEADWDNFINTLKEMGIEECIEIYQAAYDSYCEAYGV